MSFESRLFIFNLGSKEPLSLLNGASTTAKSKHGEPLLVGHFLPKIYCV